MGYSCSMSNATISMGELTDGGLSILNEKVAKFNRRATRLGLPLMQVIVEGEQIETRTQDITGLTYQVKYNLVKVIGDVPRINGWAVAARVEFTEAGNLVHVAPGFMQGVRNDWRTVGNVCQHCNSKRRRNDLIVIRHESGEEKIVGRNCVADYIRTTNADGLIAYAEAINEVGMLVQDSEREFWGDGGGRAEATETLDNVLRYASVCIRRLGWVSGAMARNDFSGLSVSTADNVRRLMYPPRNSAGYDSWVKWVKKNELYASDFDAEELELAKAWLAAIQTTTTINEYMHNLRVIRDLGYVEYSKMGYAVSIIIAAKKARDEEIKRAESEKSSGPKGYIGEVGKRLRGLSVTVKRVHPISTDYGVKTVITFDHEGNDLTWFATGDQSEDYRQGSSYTIDATVKAHRDNEKFGKSTTVNRVTTK